ncbi:MAG: AI-2E family transporter, partial [Candidatus Dormibacteraeota bacterium]|nr:AI-2E family transporter [Candidatus Dormibacteraeota bacterium]
LAIAISYVIGFTVIFGVLTLIVVTAAGEVTNFVHHLPAYEAWAENLQPEILGLLSPFGVTSAQLRQFEMGAVAALESLGTTAANDALSIVTTVLNTIVDGFLVLILSVYVTASGPRLVRWVREQAPRGQSRRANLIINIFNRVVGGYVRGTLILASMVGVLVGGGMAVLGVRYALLLGILAFFMEFVPVLGVIISGAVCVVLALFQGWVLALIVVAYFAVVHVIEGDLVGPRVMGRAIGIHPAVALLALVAGTDLFGLWGALFGAPIAGLIQAIVVAVWSELRQGEIVEARASPEPPAPEPTSPDRPAARPRTRAVPGRNPPSR